jgi:hypothetical protein
MPSGEATQSCLDSLLLKEYGTGKTLDEDGRVATIVDLMQSVFIKVYGIVNAWLKLIEN